MKYSRQVSLLIAILTVCGCGYNGHTDKVEPLDQKVSPSDIQGLWRSDGYMTLLEITDKRVLTYEVSSVHCLLVDDTALADFVRKTPHVLTNRQRKRFATDPAFDREFDNIAIHSYYYDLIDQRPGACIDGITQKDDDPVANFNVFWNVFNEQYAFFDLRNINWQQHYDDNLSAVEKVTDDEELFDILADLIDVFGNDSHVSLFANDDANTGAGAESDLMIRIQKHFQDTFTRQQLRDDFDGQIRFDNFGQYLNVRFAAFFQGRVQESFNIIAGYMVDRELQSTGNDNIIWGLMEGNIGYLAITDMEEFIDVNAAIAAVADVTLDEILVERLFKALREALDLVMADLSGADAIIIDIRLNGGGADALALEIAGRFFDQRRLVFQKKARKGDGYSEKVDIYHEPTVDKPYNKPIYLLTSGETSSAAEIFTITMRNLPYVTLVGETTEGILSDQLEPTLPNGWELSLSNEVYTAADGEEFESIGIPPTITALFLDPDYTANQRDSALEAVLQDL